MAPDVPLWDGQSIATAAGCLPHSIGERLPPPVPRVFQFPLVRSARTVAWVLSMTQHDRHPCWQRGVLHQACSRSFQVNATCRVLAAGGGTR